MEAIDYVAGMRAIGTMLATEIVVLVFAAMAVWSSKH